MSSTTFIAQVPVLLTGAGATVKAQEFLKCSVTHDKQNAHCSSAASLRLQEI